MYMNDVLENVVVFVVDAYTFDTLPTTAPDNWDTVYAIANSPYYVEDASGAVTINGKKFTQLSASDKTTAQDYDWDDYKGKVIAKAV
jgi:hypothetical protein